MQTRLAMTLALATVLAADAVEYKKNVIKGTGHSASFSTFSISSDGEFTATTNRNEILSRFRNMKGFEDFDFRTGTMQRPDIHERVKTAAAKLNRLLFIRDVCPKLEDDVTMKGEKKPLREVMRELGTQLGHSIPSEIPPSEWIVESIDVSGMPASEFIDAIASACGLSAVYEAKQIRFVVPGAEDGEDEGGD